MITERGGIRVAGVEWLRRVDRAGGGLGVDVALYVLSAAFAGITAVSSTLPPHRAWGAVAVYGYAAAALLSAAALILRRFSAIERGALVVATFVATALVPIAVQSWQRASGRLDRAQEEVPVIEQAAQRLLDTGTPYLDRAAIAALPEGERLLAYVPYQPGMAAFGLPRALFGDSAWTDARVWFALATVAALGAAIVILRRVGVADSALVRGLQVATVLPICALTLATGGDDLPVLALCLLGLAFAATGRFGGAGLAIGAAASLKLFAWPVVVVLGVYAVVSWPGPEARRASGQLWPYAAGALGLPIVTAALPLIVNAAAVVENVLAYPFGRGLVTSPAASPLPGHLLATSVPGGRILVYALLGATAVVIAVVLVRRPPRTAADAALISGLGLLAAMLLLPATRFGYLLYPVALLVWAAVLPRTTIAQRVS